MYLICETCQTPLQCMPLGAGLADFECPKCYPEGFLPLNVGTLKDKAVDETFEHVKNLGQNNAKNH